MQPESSNTEKIIITGAASLIGYFLLPKLNAAGHTVHAFSRSVRSSPEINWHQFDGSLLSANPTVKKVDSLIHLGPLNVLPEMLDDFVAMGGKRIIAFSSTSRFSKIKSGSLSERRLAQDLITAEEKIALRCEKNNLAWTIFRPTLIYGAGLDRNVSRISRFIKRFGFFPLVGNGTGLRQPVHADDLATACVMVLKNETTFDQCYNLVGGETLNYKEMVERIFIALNKEPRFFSISLALFRLLIKCASLLPAYSQITPDMANRMNHPLSYDSEQAIKDFSFKNRGFSPLQKDLDPCLNSLPNSYRQRIS